MTFNLAGGIQLSLRTESGHLGRRVGVFPAPVGQVSNTGAALSPGGNGYHPSDY